MPTRLPDRIAVFALTAMTLAAVVSVAAYWGARVEFADRFLILIGAVWAGWKAWPTHPSRPSWSSSAASLLLVTAASLAFPVAWLLQVQIGPRVLLLWWQFAAISTATAGLILIRGGWPKLRACGFALLFPFLALPIPARILTVLQPALQALTTTSADALLSVLYPVTRSGFVLALPSGPLEVAEACSGVRSLTALVAITAFVAFLRGFGPVGSSLLMLFAIPAVAATNVLRVFLSGVIQETFGAEYIRGDWHEALGFAMVLVGLAGVLGLASLFDSLSAPWESTTKPDIQTSDQTRQLLLPWLATALLLTATLGTVYAARLGWIAFSETLATVPLDRIPLRLGDWAAKGDEPIPEEVTSKLGQDTGLYRVYTNNLGQEVHCWVMYWSSLSSIRGNHNPDICWGNKGGVPKTRGVEVLMPACGGTLPVLTRRFDVTGGQNDIVYWTQDGRRVWDDETEAKIAFGRSPVGSDSTKWVSDLLHPPTDRPPGRLMVVLVTRHIGPVAQGEATELARRLGDGLYALCPWAAPPHPADEK